MPASKPTGKRPRKRKGVRTLFWKKGPDPFFSVLAVVVLDSQFLDFSRNRISSHPQQIGCVDAPPAGAGECFGDQGALELTPERVEDAGVAAGESALGFLLERGEPI